jgi:hypothetical protein
LIGRNARIAVDRDRTVEVDPRATGLLLAHAGRLFHGPGPGCLAQTPRAHARARRPGANGPRPSTDARACPISRGLLRACGPCCCWATAKSFGPAGLVSIEAQISFPISEVLFQ